MTFAHYKSGPCESQRYVWDLSHRYMEAVGWIPGHSQPRCQSAAPPAAEQTWDLRGLDLTGFRRWLDGQLARWQTDPMAQS
jgi:hypothetical protein